MKKVLVVEDELHIHLLWTIAIGGVIELIPAYSVDEAEEKFDANLAVLSVIVMDGTIRGPGEKPNTERLVRRFRGQFSGPMIATSNHPPHRQILIAAGCSHECDNKLNIPKILCELLGLPAPKMRYER